MLSVLSPIKVNIKTMSRHGPNINVFLVSADEAMDHAEGHSSASLGNPMLASIEGYTTQPANQRTPGRQKVYRCKQCNFSATIKVS